MAGFLFYIHFTKKQINMEELTFKEGWYYNGDDRKHYVVVTEEGCVFCGTGSGIPILCQYPSVNEFCDFCPLKGKQI